MADGFWDKLGSGLTSGDFLGGALTTAGTAILGMLNSSQQDDDEEEARQMAEQDWLRKLELEALKVRFGNMGGGGGGGGGGGPFTGLTDRDRLAAIAGQGDQTRSAIANLINAYQNALK